MAQNRHRRYRIMYVITDLLSLGHIQLFVKHFEMNVEEKGQLHKNRLRLIREQRGLSQFELSRLCGIGISQITRYENGVTEPSASTLGNIAQVLNVSVDYLLGLADEPHHIASDTLRPDERQLLEAYTAGDGLKMFALMYERLQKLMKLPPTSE